MFPSHDARGLRNLFSRGLRLLSLLAGIHDGPCCTRYSQKKIPKRVVKSYFYTSGNCPLPSVVFVFRNNLSTCTDPNVQWVKDLVKALDGE
uniref:C-C motif chemokine n=1 Tax=Salvator merianae TaxID=96440 RepID=A0A8D0BLL5_SALMN